MLKSFEHMSSALEAVGGAGGAGDAAAGDATVDDALVGTLLKRKPAPKAPLWDVDARIGAYLETITSDDEETAAPEPTAEELAEIPDTACCVYCDVPLDELTATDLDAWRKVCRRVRWRTRSSPASKLYRRLRRREAAVDLDDPTWLELRALLVEFQNDPRGNPDFAAASRAAKDIAAGRDVGSVGLPDAAPQLERQLSSLDRMRALEVFSMEYTGRYMSYGANILHTTAEGKLYAKCRVAVDKFDDMLAAVRKGVPRMREKGRSEEEIAAFLAEKEASKVDREEDLERAATALSECEDYCRLKRATELYNEVVGSVPDMKETASLLDESLSASGSRHGESGASFESVVESLAWDRVCAVLGENTVPGVTGVRDRIGESGAIVTGAMLQGPDTFRGRPTKIGEADVVLLWRVDDESFEVADDGFVRGWQVVAMVECKADYEDVGAALHQWRDKLGCLLDSAMQHYLAVPWSVLLREGEARPGGEQKVAKVGAPSFRWFRGDGIDRSGSTAGSKFVEADLAAAGSSASGAASTAPDLPLSAYRRLFIATTEQIDMSARIGLDSSVRNGVMRFMWMVDDDDLEHPQSLLPILEVARAAVKAPHNTDQCRRLLDDLGVGDRVIEVSAEWFSRAPDDAATDDTSGSAAAGEP